MKGIGKILAQRLLWGGVTLLFVSMIIFSAIELLPGDAAQAVLGQSYTETAGENFRQRHGLNEPAITRYFTWLGNALMGDFGYSYTTDKAVTEMIAERFSNTIFLAIYAACIAIPLSILLGLLSALYRNTMFDRSANVTTLTAISSPEFLLGYLLIFFLAIKFPLFSATVRFNQDMSLWEKLDVAFLPAITLVLVVTAHMMRMTRAAIINLLASPYIEMARLKGVPQFKIILRHALPNALAPIINVIALNLAYLITGVVIVEVVFAYKGVGQVLVDAVKNRDLPVVQACCLIFASVFILLNLLADILSILSNPRLRHPKQEKSS